MRAIQMLHEADPASALMAKAKAATDGWAVMGARVLVAVYMRPEKTASGLYLASKTRDEDAYQGKCGLIVQVGPLAFKDTDSLSFPTKPVIGDWVMFRVGDTIPFIVGEDHYRYIEDVSVLAVIDRPDSVM